MTRQELVVGFLGGVLVLALLLSLLAVPWNNGSFAWLGGPKPYVLMCECFEILYGQKPACPKILADCNATQAAKVSQSLTPPAWWPWGH